MTLPALHSTGMSEISPSVSVSGVVSKDKIPEGSVIIPEFISQMKKFFELLPQHEEWQIANFGPQQPYQMLYLGMGEELGELKHSILKGCQCIRGTKEEHTAAVRDAIADVGIYAMGYMESCNIRSYSEIVRAYPGITTFSNYTSSMVIPPDEDAKHHALAKYCETFPNIIQVMDLLPHIDSFLSSLGKSPAPEICLGLLRSLDYLSCLFFGERIMTLVEETFHKEVQKRDWKKHPGNGVSE